MHNFSELSLFAHTQKKKRNVFLNRNNLGKIMKKFSAHLKFRAQPFPVGTAKPILPFIQGILHKKKRNLKNKLNK